MLGLEINADTNHKLDLSQCLKLLCQAFALLFQISPLNCQEFRKSRVFFSQSKLFDDQIFKDTDIISGSSFICYGKSTWVYHYMSFDFAVDYINLKHFGVIRKSELRKGRNERLNR